MGATDPIFSDAVLTTLINASLRRMSVKHDWPWLEQVGTVNTVADQQSITLLNAYRKIVYLEEQNRRLEFVSRKRVADFHDRTGRPHSWTEFAGTILLLPTPDRVFEISYGIIREAETPLSGATDVPLMPDWAIDLLIADTSVLVARRKRDPEMEGRFYGERQMFEKTITDEIAQGVGGQLPDRPRWRSM